MNIAELLNNIKNVKMESLVWQDEILTEEDKIYYQQKGYSAEFTKAEFEAKFNIPSECICYTPSISDRVLYFNRKTLAANPFAMWLIVSDETYLQGVCGAIEAKETQVHNGDFMSSILSLPDSLRIEYFNMLIERKIPIKDLYSFFKDLYILSDYGFSTLSPITFDKVVLTKTDEQKKQTLDAFKKYPDEITIYRGHTEGISTPEDKAYSWTTDIRVANFFATKLGSDSSEIIVATIQKDKIIEYIDDRNESEVWVNYKDTEIQDRIKLPGMELINEILPLVSEDYLLYKSELSYINFNNESELHGRLHTLRVILHILFLSYLLRLSEEDKEILCNAALWHDTGRIHDEEDLKHGYYGRLNYENSFCEPEIPDHYVSFIIEFHSRPDEDGLVEIENNPLLNQEKTRITKLYNVFKDADGLDRVRLGLRDLNLNYLRFPESKTLSKIARIFLEQIK